MSDLAYYIPETFGNVENTHPLVPRLHQFVQLNLELMKHLGANAAVIYTVFVERMQKNWFVCKHNHWWFPYSYTAICKKTKLTMRQVRYALEKLEETGVIEVSCMNSQTGQRCYRVVPTDIKNGELSPCTGYFKAQGIPKENYVTINPIPYDMEVYLETGEYVLPAQKTSRRRSVPGTRSLGSRGGRCQNWHLDAKIGTPSEQKLEADDTPEFLGVTSSTRVRGRGRANNVFIHNKIGVKNDTYICDNLEIEELHKNKQNKFTPTQREEQFTKYVLNRILENFPNISKDAQKKILQSGPKCVRQLSNKFGFKAVKEVLNWGLFDPFWKKQIRSLSPLLRPSKTHPEYKKFEMIKMAYEGQQKDPEDELMDEIESLARTQSEDPNEIETIVDNVIWLQEEIDNINENKVVRVRWSHSDSILKVFKWLIFIESRIIENKYYKTWDDILVEYFEYLKRFVLNGPDKPLYAGHFDPKKSSFQNFAAFLERKHGEEILDI